MNTAQSQPSAFFALPVEVRLQIYDYVFSSPSWSEHRLVCPTRTQGHSTTLMTACRSCTILNSMERPPPYPPAKVLLCNQTATCYTLPPKLWQYYYRGYQSVHAWSGHPKHRTAILQTCWQIYAEAVEVLYDNTLFLVEVKTSSTEPYDSDNYSSWSEQAGYLRQIRHLDMTVRLGRPCDLWLVGDTLRILFRHLDVERKSTTTSLSFRGFARPRVGTSITPEMWMYFLEAVKTIDLQGDLVMLWFPGWLKEGTVRFEELDKAAGGRLMIRNWPLPIHSSNVDYGKDEV